MYRTIEFSMSLYRPGSKVNDHTGNVFTIQFVQIKEFEIFLYLSELNELVSASSLTCEPTIFSHQYKIS